MMKKILTSSLFLLVSSFLAAKADLLYFMADVDDWDTPTTFDFAMIGVAKYDKGSGTWATIWDDTGSQMYQHLYDAMDSTLDNSEAVTKDGVAENFADYTRGSDADEKTAVGWADVSDYKGENFKFYIEVYADGKGTSFLNELRSYDELLSANHIYQPGSTDAQPVTPWAVPEPVSGLLVLLGAGLAAWRRRRRARDARRETRAGLAVVLALLSCFSFAGADDTLISFSTKGPDTYADGTTVKDGECYALVWTRAGASFEGLAADGSAVGTNSRVVVFAPIAKGGRCPPALFEIDATLAKSYAGGAFAVYLLDTRLASGAVGGVSAQGAPAAVNGWGTVGATFLSPQSEDETSASGGDRNVAPTGARFSITTRSALPANAPKPTITAIRLVGDNVYLTVKGTLPCLKYTAQEVAVGAASCRTTDDDDSSAVARQDASPTGSTQGAASTDDEITIIAPKKGTRGFYSVQRD